MANKQFAHAKQLAFVESFLLFYHLIFLISRAKRIATFVGHESNHIWSENLVLEFPKHLQ